MTSAMLQPWLALLACTLALCLLPPVDASSRTCFCELRTGKITFSPLLLEVDDPVLTAPLVTCRRARLWCPSKCFEAARARLLNGGSGGVAPISGNAGETACQALATEATADTQPSTHVYAVYRVSNCHDSGFFYLGRLCCWKYLIGDDTVYKFNEGCECGDAPPCAVDTTTEEATTEATTGSPTKPETK